MLILRPATSCCRTIAFASQAERLIWVTQRRNITAPSKTQPYSNDIGGIEAKWRDFQTLQELGSGFGEDRSPDCTLRKLRCVSAALLQSSRRPSRLPDGIATIGAPSGLTNVRHQSSRKSKKQGGSDYEAVIKFKINPTNVTFNERSETFAFEPLDENAKGPYESIEIFTTRADTVFGALFLALSPGHPLVLHEAQHDSDLQAFLEAAKTVRHPDSGKTPGHLLNISAFNPIREVNAMAAFPAHRSRAYMYRPMPIFVAPYVASVSPERGAIMGVPAHNRRDHTFWRHIVEEKPIPSVISRIRLPGRPDPTLNKVKFLAKNIGDKPFEEKGRLNALCGLFAGLCSDAAIQLLPERVPGITPVGRTPQINTSFLRRMWDLI